MSSVRSYEKATAELDEIMEKLASDDVTLEDSVSLYAKAAELIEFCDKTLREASLKMETITQRLHAGQEDE